MISEWKADDEWDLTSIERNGGYKIIPYSDLPINPKYNSEIQFFPKKKKNSEKNAKIVRHQLTK